MAAVELRGVVKRYDGRTNVVHGIDLDVRDGEFVVFVGPSGCGKSTLLRMIAGLESISGGEIRIDGEIVNDRPPRARDIAMVFQDYALYPHKTVRENLAFGLRIRRFPEAQIEARLRDAARMLRIEALLDRLPGALSGGQRQRVAIGRAIVRQPKVFLFDEPLSNLDAQLRQEMRGEIKRLHQRLGSTMIYVTHDQVEAMTMADRIAVLSAGRRIQYDTPDAIYNRPAAKFVAGFTGAPAMNLAEVRVADGHATLGEGVRVPLPPALAACAGACTLGVRPENLRVVGDSATVALPATVVLLEPLGAETLVTLRIGAAEMIARFGAAFREPPDSAITVHVDPRHLHLFDPASGDAIVRPPIPTSTGDHR